jgi:hypothetical protein
VAFWLSHVPPDALPGFLERMRGALGPSGTLMIIDQYAPSEADLAIMRDGMYADRTVADGRTFSIVKVFHDLDVLQDETRRLGMEPEVRLVDDGFFILRAAGSPA